MILYGSQLHFYRFLQRWGAPTPTGIELEDRQVPFVPQRLPPSEPLESALEQVNVASFNAMAFPLPRPLQVSNFLSTFLFVSPQLFNHCFLLFQSVVDDDNKAENTVYYEQYAGENNLLIKQGKELTAHDLCSR